MIYPLAPNPVFWTIQGEGHLRGFQMAFVRLAGCSVGCAECDTDYRVDGRADAGSIAAMVAGVIPDGDRDRWAWITGGEPTDHDLRPLITALRRIGCSVAIATSGKRRVIPPVDWLSVSAHSADPADFVQRYGSELKLCDGLNGIDIDAWVAALPDERTDFFYRYVQPLSIRGRESPASLTRCIEFLRRHPRWALSRQDHHTWGVP